jgi:protein involved in polysaccharide export with SLBB domain
MTFFSPLRQKRATQMMMLFLSSLLFGFTALAHAEPGYDAHITYEEGLYLLGPGDVFDVKVLHEPDYSQTDVLIQPDGHASFLGTGEMNINHMSVKELTDELTRRLEKTLVNPQVTVSITHTRPAILYLSGAVVKPGMYQLNTSASAKDLHLSGANEEIRTELRLSNVLANAGGVRMNADLAHVRVTQAVSNRVTDVNLWDLLKAHKTDADLLLQSGDMVYIPALDRMALNEEEYTLLLQSSIGPKVFQVRVLGEIRNPGVYDLDGNSPYLNSALSKAGGYVPQSNRAVIAIRRFSDENHFSTFFVDPNKFDIQLRPNDVVFIPETRLAKSGRVMEQVAKVLSPFQTTASTAAGVSQVFGLGGWSRKGL